MKRSSHAQSFLVPLWVACFTKQWQQSPLANVTDALFSETRQIPDLENSETVTADWISPICAVIVVGRCTGSWHWSSHFHRPLIILSLNCVLYTEPGSGIIPWFENKHVVPPNTINGESGVPSRKRSRGKYTKKTLEYPCSVTFGTEYKWDSNGWWSLLWLAAGASVIEDCIGIWKKKSGPLD